MKKMSLCIVWLAILFCLGGGKKVYAAEVTSVAINQSNFPDKNVRKVIAKEFDKDKNKILSEKELKAAKELYLDWIDNDSVYVLNIEGISKLKYIKKLSVEVKLIKNLSELEKMPQLTSLVIHSRKNKEIDISSYVNVRNLELNMPLRQVDLSKNTKLQDLSLNCTKIKNISIKGLIKLQKILIAGNLISKSITVRNCPQLKKVSIYNNSGKSVTVRDCPRLKKVSTYNNIYYNPCKSITVRDCPELKSLSCISEKEVKKVTVKNLPNLYHLNLNNLPKIKKWNLPYMPQLRELKMRTSIKKHDFRKVPNLRVLIVKKNKKATVADLRPLKKLKELTWQNGRLKKIRFGKKKKLENMYLQHNQLGGTWRLSRLPKLYEFNCSYNKIKKIYAGKHKSLGFLICRKNGMKKLDLRHASELMGLDCEKNPKLKLHLSYLDSKYFYFDKTAKVTYKEKW